MIVLFDPFLRGVYEGSIIPNLPFELLDYDEAGNVVVNFTKALGLLLTMDT
jgi:hypothetical protein